jgi:RND superfamily putative drug exporter
LAVYMLAVSVLGIVGLGLEGHLHQRASLEVPGTPSQDAEELATQRFGKTTPLVVLLEGPRSAVDRQGAPLAAAIEREPGLTVLSPWPRNQEALRPKPDTAFMIIRSESDFERTSEFVTKKVRREVDQRTHAPVEAHMTGNPDVSWGIKDATVKAVQRAEVVAAPLLMIVLLFVFRSVVAASIPLFVGGITITAGRGLLEIVNNGVYLLDAIALNLYVMMGLALGVDYALLMVSRFREELDRGLEPREATLTAAATAGRTVVVAGIAVVVAVSAATPVVPGELLVSSTIGIIIAAAVSVVGAMTVLPAALVLIGRRINSWSIGRSRGGDSRFGLLAIRILRRPLLATLLVFLLIGAMATPALGLDMGPPSTHVLPKDQPEEVDFSAVEKKLGTGWTSPYEVIVAAHRGPLTNQRQLDALDRFQQRLAANPMVEAVMGPGEIARRTRPLEQVPAKLAQADSELGRALQDQAKLQSGLAAAGGGVDELRRGLSAAASGAGELARGGSAASTGADRLRAGIAAARRGARQMGGGLAVAREGAAALGAGAGRARDGLAQLRDGLGEARGGVQSGIPRVTELADGLDRGSRDLNRLREPAQNAKTQLDEALAALDRMLPTSKVDPEYQNVFRAVATAQGNITGRNPLTGQQVDPEYDGLDSALAQASQQTAAAAAGARELRSGLERLDAGLADLEAGAVQLHTGAGQLEDGLAELVTGLDRLRGGGAALAAGLGKLEVGGTRLASGMRRLEGGAGELEQGLGSGARQTGLLRDGVRRMETGVAEGRVRTKELAAGLDGTDALASAARSGYFALAAIDKSPPSLRRISTFALNVDRGGSAVRFLVIGKGDVVREGHPLRPVLERETARLARETGAEVQLGGFATRLQDYEKITEDQFWVLVVVLSIVAFLILVPVLRSVLLPLLAVGLTGFTVAAACGILALLFQGHPPLLGGAGWVDAIMLFGVYTIAFALSIDYQAFLLMRMREGHMITGTTEGAIDYGLRRTAGVVTGAALSMTGVFVAFAQTDLVVTRQLGVGMTTAVMLDATLVRLVLLPASLRLFGKWCWWLPRPLQRLLPEGAAAPAPAASPVPAGGS